MAGSATQLSVSRNDGDRGWVLGVAHALDDPVVGRGRKLDHHPGLITARRNLGRTRAIEHEAYLSVRIREAPGESDQALSHGVGPERLLGGGCWVRCAGGRAKWRAVEGVVTVDEPESRGGEGIEVLGVLTAGIFLLSYRSYLLNYRGYRGTDGLFVVRSVRDAPPRAAVRDALWASCEAQYGIGSANPRRTGRCENPLGTRPVLNGRTGSRRPVRPSRAQTAQNKPSPRVPEARPQSPREPQRGSSTPRVVVDSEAVS